MVKIDVWNGEDQAFGRLGNPQRWVNILGNVSADGAIASLTCAVNGGQPKRLSVGSDGLRLQAPGDFNAEVPLAELRPGENSVLLEAVSSNGERATSRVNVHYTAGRRWPLPYTVGWENVEEISDVIQIVDGRWGLSPEGIRPLRPHYDRLVTFGDMRWQDYDISVEATIHGFNTALGAETRLMGGFGILNRWRGHSADEHQPSREWRPNGTIGWYRARWEERPATVRCLNISDAVEKDRVLVEAPPMELPLDEPHVYQMRVMSRADGPSEYTYRVWHRDSPDQLRCDLTTRGKPGESPRGSILLIALHVDVTIGAITARPIE